MPIREPEGQRRLARTDPEPAHTRATMALRPICLGTHSDAGRARSGEGAPTGRGAERPSYGQSDRESLPQRLTHGQLQVGGMIPAVEVAMEAAEEW